MPTIKKQIHISSLYLGQSVCQWLLDHVPVDFSTVYNKEKALPPFIIFHIMNVKVCKIMEGSKMDREAILKAMTVAELAPAAVDCELTMQPYSKLPISRIAALGVGLEPVMAALQQMTSHGQAVSGYYRRLVSYLDSSLDGEHIIEVEFGGLFDRFYRVSMDG
ncbi:hypothetical protein ACTQ4E_15745 [Lawsonibacter sp. LCP25S3_G6]|uniref:hypothetical protein n=1 Tax=unclassified Lawsonibacter TaxID=2617946 RepID=UPI003F9D428F